MCIRGCHDDSGVLIDCPCCKGIGCEECEDGKFTVACPRAYCSDIADDINVASCASKGFLPVQGGLLDQTNWFLQLWSMLDAEHAAIEAERWNSE